MLVKAGNAVAGKASEVVRDSESARICIRGVSKRFKSKRGVVTALDNVDLDIGESERVVLLGPSGCGKTTLLRCVAGLEKPDSGQIRIGNKIVYCSDKGVFVPAEKRDLSMMFQSYALWPHMTVHENVAFPLENRKIPATEVTERVRAALSLVKCDALHARYPSQLSGGQQQRIALARAIVANDSVILFDEPLSNVDAKVREQLRVELVALQRRFGFAALYVTHDQIEATAVADRIAVFDAGRLVQIGEPRQIYMHPASSSVAEFVGSTNRLRASLIKAKNGIVELQTIIGKVHARQPKRDLGSGEMVLHFKPEHLVMGKLGTLADGPNRFEAELETEMFLGGCTEYSILLAGERFILRSLSPEIFKEGSKVSVAIDPDHIQIYPAVEQAAAA